jgi:predicted Zn-dependent peptidase
VLSTSPERSDAVLDEVRGILGALAAGDITQDELDRVRDRKLARTALDNQDPSPLLGGAMARVLHGDPITGTSAWRESLVAVDLDAVDLDAVNQAAVAFLAPRRLCHRGPGAGGLSAAEAPR